MLRGVGSRRGDHEGAARGVHQLTDLPPGLDRALMAEATARNAQIRDEGTRNLVDATVRACVRRLVAQSVAFADAGVRLRMVNYAQCVGLEASRLVIDRRRNAGPLDHKELGGLFRS
jgi:hypothetical protein